LRLSAIVGVFEQQQPASMQISVVSPADQEEGAATTITNTFRMPSKQETADNDVDAVGEEFGKLTVQRVAQLAVAAHAGEQQQEGGNNATGGDGCSDNEEDAHTDLLPITRSISRRTSFKRNTVAGFTAGVPRRTQSMQAARRPPTSGGAAALPPGVGVAGVAGPNGETPPRAPLRSYSSQYQRRTPSRTPSGSGGPGGGGLARSRSGMGGGRRLAPGRSISSDGSLRGFRRDQLVNVSIRSKDAYGGKDGGGTRGQLMRTRSGDDLSICSGLDSCFTTDSINLRKSQLIADPLDDAGTYHSYADSYADHDTVFDTFSQCTTAFDGYQEFPPDHVVNSRVGVVIRGDASVGDNSFATLESFQIHAGMQVNEPLDEVSFFSNTNSYSDFDLEETMTEAYEETATEACVESTQDDTLYSETVE